MAEKKCSRCVLLKPISHFCKNRRKADGLHYYCRSCMRISQQEHRARHPDKAVTRQSLWRERNREKVNSMARSWRERNREKYISIVRKWKRLNPDKAKAVCAAWRAKYPHRAKAASSANSAMRRSAIASGVSNCEVSKWILLQPKECLWCGKDCGSRFEIDHVVPLSRGGRHELVNLCISCKKCNLSKHALMPEEFLARIKIEHGEIGRSTFNVSMLEAA